MKSYLQTWSEQPWVRGSAIAPRIAIIALLLVPLGARGDSVPLPIPPFTYGGYVPASAARMRSELDGAEALSRWGGDEVVCSWRAVRAAAGGDPGAGAKLASCRARALARWTRTSEQLAAGVPESSPACLVPGLENSRQHLLGNVALLNPLVFCAGSVDSGIGIGVPSDPVELDGEIRAYRLVTSTGGRTAACFMRAGRDAFRGDLMMNARLAKCLGRAQARLVDGSLDLEVKGLLPSCLSRPIVNQLGQIAAEFASYYTYDIACE